MERSLLVDFLTKGHQRYMYQLTRDSSYRADSREGQEEEEEEEEEGADGLVEEARGWAQGPLPSWLQLHR